MGWVGAVWLVGAKRDRMGTRRMARMCILVVLRRVKWEVRDASQGIEEDGFYS